MTIHLKNSATGQKEPFAPLDDKNVRMYVCGPTVYDRAHLGNARPVVVFDVLYRLLRHVYGAEAVTYVRNFTDVDDKINATALARKEAGAAGTLEELVTRRSNETIDWYHADMDALGALRPNHAPRATEYIPQMIAMIEGLIAKGNAYAAEGHVLFNVDSDPTYGSLSGRSVDDMIAGARVEVAPYKKNPMDFVLWKPSDDELPGWPSPWGRGRPGWHIECSAMAHDLLGERFDIHGGGNDLLFPHHENEIAQSRCCGHGFAEVWLHNEMLQVEGKKMSKSLGNFFTVRDLLDKGVPGEVIRLVFLGTHYRKPMDWTEKKRAEAEATLRKWAAIIGEFGSAEPSPAVVSALADDLNTSEVVHILNELFSQDERDVLSASLSLVGIDPIKLSKAKWANQVKIDSPNGSIVIGSEEVSPSVSLIGWGHISEDVREPALAAVRKWMALRILGDWLAADELKSAALDAGLSFRATKSDSGVPVGIAKIERAMDLSKLKALV